jgi:hypothetical protein
MSNIDSLKTLQTNVLPNTSKAGLDLSKTISTLSNLSSEVNKIASFLNNSSVEGSSGNPPLTLKSFAKEFASKSAQQEATSSNTDSVADSNPKTKKFVQISSKLITQIINQQASSGRMLYLLESQVSRILQQSKVTYVKVENGQIVAQPIQNTEINLALANIQKTVDSIINNIDRYAKRIYNENPITTVEDLKNNLSLNKIIDFINTVLSIYLDVLQIQIKIRKSQDIAAAANALATVPPQPLVAARYTQASLELTANEQKKLNDLVAAYFQIKNIDDQITFYGKKYIKQKARLSDLKGTIDSFITSTTNKTLTQLNNQITGSLNHLTGSLDKKLNN